MIETAILVVHVLALLVGGGLALAFDRSTSRAARTSPTVSETFERRAVALRELGAAHRLVGTSLGVSIVTGTLLFALHAERYVTAGLFWSKMALVIGLAANAFVMLVTERAIREAEAPHTDGGPGGSDVRCEAAWRRLGGSARISSALWILVAAAGTVLGQVR